MFGKTDVRRLLSLLVILSAYLPLFACSKPPAAQPIAEQPAAAPRKRSGE